MAVAEFLKMSDYAPEELWLAGLGTSAEEITVFREFWPEIEVTAFEPNPNIGVQGLHLPSDVNIHRCALSDYEGETDIHIKYGWGSGASLYKGEHETSKKCLVKRLDSFRSRPDTLLWLDCEGSELDALRGSGAFLDNVTVLNIELTGLTEKRSAGTWPKPVEIHKFLRERGFLQVYVHTIRPCVGQFDAIYMRPEIVKPEMVSCLPSLLEIGS